MWENTKKIVSKIKCSWSEVTIAEWQEFMKARKEFSNIAKDREVTKLDFDLAQIDFDNKLLSIFSDKDEDYWNNIDIIERNKALSKLKFISQDQPEIKINNSYKIGGIKYYIDISQKNFMRNSIASLKASQYISLIDQYRDVEDPYVRAENLHIEMSILCIPKGKEFGSGDYNGFTISEHLRHNMTMDIASSVSKFFFLKLISLTTALERSLKRDLNRQLKSKVRDPKKLAEVQMLLERAERLSREIDLRSSGDGHTMRSL